MFGLRKPELSLLGICRFFGMWVVLVGIAGGIAECIRDLQAMPVGGQDWDLNKTLGDYQPTWPTPDQVGYLTNVLNGTQSEQAIGIISILTSVVLIALLAISTRGDRGKITESESKRIAVAVIPLVAIAVCVLSINADWYAKELFGGINAGIAILCVYGIYFPAKWDPKKWVEGGDGKWHLIIKDKVMGGKKIVWDNDASTAWSYRGTFRRWAWRKLIFWDLGWVIANITFDHRQPLAEFVAACWNTAKYSDITTTHGVIEIGISILITILVGILLPFAYFMKYVGWIYSAWVCFDSGILYAYHIAQRKAYPPNMFGYISRTMATDPTGQQAQGGERRRRGSLG